MAFHPRYKSQLTNATAGFLLALMAALMFTSAWDDAIIFDEEPHIAAGYSYLVKQDYRFNPEHPPLMKDLGAFPLLFMNLQAPWTEKSWTEDFYGQWDFGHQLIFKSGGNPERITRTIKVPMILFTLGFGWLVFWWTRKQIGDAAALLALFLFTFSPTFLAHGRFITTDVGAAAGFFIGTIAYLHFLKNPSLRNMVLAGLAMGFAFLTKFSAILLIPAAFILAVLWALLTMKQAGRLRAVVRSLASTFAIFVIASLVVYAVYLHHTWNYPPERQRADTANIIASADMHGEIKGAVLWASDKPLLRPWAEYAIGALMVIKRSRVGNSPFFLGEIFPVGQRFYFPFVYLVKEPLAVHLLTLLALAFGISRWLRPAYSREWIKAHFTEVGFLVVIAIYWAASIQSHLNIGVRHLLPTLPLVYILVASELARRDHTLAGRQLALESDAQGDSRESHAARKPRALWTFRLLLAAMLTWQAVTVIRIHPSYLAYFNELAGGPDAGWEDVVDSNIDWGQDLKRLADFVEQRNIPEIHFDYFGSADRQYYLKDRDRGMSSCDAPHKGWVAVSAMWYADSRRKPECDYRRWLPMEKLYTKIGYSIFVFHIE